MADELNNTEDLPEMLDNTQDIVPVEAPVPELDKFEQVRADQQDFLESYLEPVEFGRNYGVSKGIEAAEKAAKEEARNAEEAPEFGELFFEAVDVEQVHNSFFKDMFGTDYKPDPLFFAEEETIKELWGDVPGYSEDVRRSLQEQATSQPHLQSIIKRYQDTHRSEEILNEAGIKGVAARVIAAFTDPAALAVSAVTEGVAAPLIYGGKVSRLGRAVRSGTIAGVTNAGIEAALVVDNPYRDATDVLAAAIAGFGLGGAGGLVIGGAVRDPNVISALGVQPMKGEIPAGTTYKEVIAEASERVLRQMELEEARLNGLEATTKGSDYYKEQLASTPKTAFSGVRFDMAGQLGGSDNVNVRRLAADLTGDSVGKQGHEVVEFGASEIMFSVDRGHRQSIMRSIEPNYQEYLKSNGIKNNAEQLKEFNERVSKAVRDPSLEGDKHVLKAAKELGLVHKNILKQAKAVKLPGFEDIPENENFMGRYFKRSKVTAAAQKFDDDEIGKLIHKSLDFEIDPKIGARIGKGYWRIVRGLQEDESFDFVRKLTEGNRESIEKILREGELDEDNIKSIMSQLKPKADDDGRISSAKSRLAIKEDRKVTIKDKQGNEVTTSFDDLILENDAFEISNRYSRQLSGRIALANRGIKSDADFEKRISEIKRAAQDSGDTKNLDRDIKSIQTIYDFILGRPLKEPSLGNQIAGTLMRANFFRLMGKVGFAQVSEFGTSVGELGLWNTIKHVPEYGRIMARAKDGNLELRLARELEQMAGVGGDRYISKYYQSFDFDGTMPGVYGDGFNKVNKGIHQANRLVSDGSGMSFITTVTQRAASMAAVQNFLDLAVGKTAKAGRMSAERLAYLGLDDAMTERILEQIRKHVVPEIGNQKLSAISLNAHTWTDVEALDNFLMSVGRWSKTVIQQNDIGEVNRMMTETTGQMLFQFRTFTMVAYAKQLLRGAHQKDLTTFASFMWSSAFAALGWTMQQAASGRADEITMEDVAKASFARAGWASILPTVIDSGLSLYADDPLFAYRSSGLDQNIVTGNPTYDLIFNKIGPGVTGLSKAITRGDKQFSQTDARNLTGAFMTNLIPVQHTLNSLIENLPKNSSFPTNN